MTGLDLFLGGVLCFSAVLGAMRGLVLELVSLAAWVLAWWLASSHSERLAGLAGMQVSGGWDALLAFVLVFVATLLVAGLLGRLLKAALGLTPFWLVDRLGGAVFGLLRGLLVLLLLVALARLTPLATQPIWKESAGAVWLEGVHQRVAPWAVEAWRKRQSATVLGHLGYLVS
ncbi:CvpA family protein [Ideonella livida]|uniref:CvpA family protein n=1 Tax=Ideonella livida TaxID=2707176 RepID=A0A7C9TLA8_9BURK|nr:CvpA family protein [Ideonella livida]NDY92143.1 CvpA family protein [Ideonella livida]